jgi:hypothetical protein
MAILATEKVLTHNYWKPASKIEVGDYLFDRLGKPTRVTLVREYYAQDCYRVTLSDGLTISGDKHLALPTENPKYRNRVFTYKGVHKFRRPLRPINMQTLVDTPLRGKNNVLLYSVPSTAPIELSHQDLPVHPFVFGFWFINKNPKDHIKIPKEHTEYVTQKLKDCGYAITHWRDKQIHIRVYSTEPTVKSQLIPNVPIRIPNNYLMAAPEQRIELLSGILYAKRSQYNKKSDTFRITGKVSHLMRQIQGLVESLGIKTHMSYREDFNEYTLTFKSRLKLMEHQESPKLKVHQARRYIEHVKQIEPQMCVHIETEGADKSFLVGEGFISCL